MAWPRGGILYDLYTRGDGAVASTYLVDITWQRGGTPTVQLLTEIDRGNRQVYSAEVNATPGAALVTALGNAVTAAQAAADAYTVGD